MGRQLGIYHGQGQPRGITPTGEESHQPAPLSLISPAGRCGARTTGQAFTDQFGSLSTIIRDVDIRHRIGDMSLRHALVTQLPLERPPRPAPPAAATAHPLRGEIRIVYQSPHPDAVQRLVHSVRGVLFVQQALAQLVLATWPVAQQPQRHGGRLVGLGGQRRQILGARRPRFDRGDGSPELVGVELRTLTAGM